VSLDTVTDEFPVFVSVTGSFLLVPSVTFPKARDVGLADNNKLWLTLVPLNGTVTREFGALLVIVIVPTALPEVAGEKRTVKAVDWPGATVVGSVGPVIPNPVPPIVACEIIKLAFPESRTVSVCVLDVPSATPVKLTAAGTTVICGCMPVALSGTVKVGLLALLVKVKLPVAAPIEVALKLSFSETCFPAARVKGTAIPAALNSFPTVATLEIVTLPAALLVIVSVCELLLPTFTFPRFKLAGFDVRPAVVAGVNTTSRK
jgi:hypothetical protein